MTWCRSSRGALDCHSAAASHARTQKQKTRYPEPTKPMHVGVLSKASAERKPLLTRRRINRRVGAHVVLLSRDATTGSDCVGTIRVLAARGRLWGRESKARSQVR